MCLKPKFAFKSNSKNKVEDSRHCRVVLRDVLKCKVQLDRLSSAQIARAAIGDIVSIQNKQITKQQTQRVYEHQDHSYSRASIVSYSPPSSDEVSSLLSLQRTASTGTINSLYGTFGLSSDNDDDDDDDDDEINGYDVVNGKRVAYQVIPDEGTDNVGRTHIFAMSNGEDAQSEENSVINNGDYTEEREQINGMDAEHTPDSSSDFGDSDEEMQFLNSIAEKLDQSEDVETANCDENGVIWPSNRIFGEICLKYLRDTCYGTYCDFPHELPDAAVIEARLRSASRREIEEAQNQILLQHEVLMAEFFALFCKFYGREWQTHRESLRYLISVLSSRPAAGSYMKEIFDGFLISGMEYSTCIDQLLLEIDDSLNSEERFEIIWELMIDPRNDRIDEQLKEFKHLLIGDALVAASAINRILQHQINGDLEVLRDATINIVKSTTVITFLKLDPTLLKQYIQLLRSLNLAAGKVIQNKAKQFGVILDC